MGHPIRTGTSGSGICVISTDRTGLQEGRPESGANLPGSSEDLGPGVTGSQGWDTARGRMDRNSRAQGEVPGR